MECGWIRIVHLWGEMGVSKVGIKAMAWDDAVSGASS